VQEEGLGAVGISGGRRRGGRERRGSPAAGGGVGGSGGDLRRPAARGDGAAEISGDVQVMGDAAAEISGGVQREGARWWRSPVAGGAVG